MRPLATQTHTSKASSARITIRATVKLLAIFLIAVAVPLALYVRVKSEGSPSWLTKAVSSVTGTDSAKRPKNHITVQAAGRGKPFLNLQDGREMRVTYRGDRRGSRRFAKRRRTSKGLGVCGFRSRRTPDVVIGLTPTTAPE